MIADGHTSKEWLIYRDWSDRWKRKRTLPLKEDTFESAIRSIAKKVRKGKKKVSIEKKFDLKDIQKFLPQEDKDGRILEELIEGSAFEKAKESKSNYTPERSRIVYALGMMLAEDLCSKEEKLKRRTYEVQILELDERIKSWLEPHKEMDLKGEIIRAAIFSTLMFDKSYDATIQSLLRCWLLAQNLPENGQETLNGYSHRLIEHYIQAAEYFWTEKNNNKAAQNRLVNAFLDLHMGHKKRPTLFIKTINSWMRICLNTSVSVPHTILGIKDLPIKVGDQLIGNTFIRLTDDIITQKLANLSQHLISVGGFSSFIPGFQSRVRALALCPNLSGGNAFQWLVHYNELHFLDLMTSTVSDWQHSSTEIKYRAAILLAQLIGTKKYSAIVKQLQNSTSGYTPLSFVTHVSDNLLRPSETWGDAALLDETPIEEKTRISAQVPFDFQRHVKTEVIQYALSELIEKNSKGIWAFGKERLLVHEYLPLLCRFKPIESAAFIRNNYKYTTGGKAFTSLESYSLLRNHILLLNFAGFEKQLINLEELFRIKRTSKNYLRLNVEPVIDVLLSLSQAKSQINFLSNYPIAREQFPFLLHWIRSLPNDHALDCLQNIYQSLDIASVLCFLSCNSISLTQEAEDILLKIINDNNDDEAFFAIKIGQKSKSKSFGNKLFNTGFVFNNWYERSEWSHMGAQTLAELAIETPLISLAKRMDISSLGLALVRRGLIKEEVQNYFHLLKEALNKALQEFKKNPIAPIASQYLNSKHIEGNVTKSQFPKIDKHSIDPDTPLPHIWSNQTFNRPALVAICRAYQNETMEWLSPLYEPDGNHLFNQLQSFYLPLIGALMEVEPESGCKAWQHVQDFDQMIRIRDQELDADYLASLLFLVSDSKSINQLRTDFLDSAVTDKAIFNIVVLARTSNRTEWLNQAIGRKIKMQRLWDRAVGLMLAAFLGVDDKQWEKYVKISDVRGTWVEDCLETIDGHRKNEFCMKHWFTQYLSHEKREYSWAGYHLMKMCIDQRYWIWRNEMIEDHLKEDTEENDFRRRFINYIDQDTVEQAKKNVKELDDCLFGIQIPKGEIHPFLDL